MIIKRQPEDFIVDEVFDLDAIRTTEGGPYFYFKLTKKDYTQMRAIQTVARIFNTSIKRVHFSGTKDRVGVTSQLISIQGLKRDSFQKNLDFFNEKMTDMSLEFLGTGDERVNLGVHDANKFTITVRDVSVDELERFKKRVQNISRGVLNLYGDQRFGFAGISHEIGRAIINEDVDNAVFMILTSVPHNNVTEENKTYLTFMTANWEEIKLGNKQSIETAVKLAPRFYRDEIKMISFFEKHPNDVSGALRLLPKKLRTLYINAYQSDIFNNLARVLGRDELPLVSSDLKADSDLTDKLLGLGVDLSKLDIPHMPELKPLGDVRERVVHINDFEYSVSLDVVTVSFTLPKGSYATVVLDFLFKEDEAYLDN